MTNDDKLRRALWKMLRKLRQDAGLTQVDVAQRLSQPQSYVSKYESGARRLDLIEIIAVCSALGVKAEVLLNLIEEEISIK